MKRIDELDVANKKVIVRVDYNVSIENDKILDTKRIDDSFETLDYLVNKGAKIILLSHFGRIKSEEDKNSNSLLPVYEYIKSLNKYDIIFVSTPMGEELDNNVNTLKPGQILLVENTRFLDLDGNLESGNDVQLAMYWASLADIYVDEAFGCMHRNHASIVGIPKFIPGGIGFLVEKELENINKITTNPERPLTVIMGGAKLEDKIDLIYSLAENADHILLGGGIANTFLKAKSMNTGSSLVSESHIVNAKQVMAEYPDKIVYPIDVITSPSYSETIYNHKEVENIDVDDFIGDIGPKTIQTYAEIIFSSKTIFLNGTMGIYEKKEFSNGTNEILRLVANSKAFKVVGGGDAASALKKFNHVADVNFVSTGGGATLKYLVDGTLPGLQILENK